MIRLDPYVVWLLLTDGIADTDPSVDLPSDGWYQVVLEAAKASTAAGAAAGPPWRCRSQVLRGRELREWIRRAVSGRDTVLRWELSTTRGIAVGAATDPGITKVGGAKAPPNALWTPAPAGWDGLFKDVAASPSIGASLVASATVQTGQQPEQPNAPASGGRLPPIVCVIDDRPNFAAPAVAARLDDVLVLGADRHVDRELRRSGRYVPAQDKAGAKGAAFGRRLKLDAFRPPASPGVPTAAIDETLAYQQAAFMHATPHASHGSAVLGAVLQGLRDTPSVRLRLVQLPLSTVLDTGGGALAASVLSGIDDAVASAPGRDVIVNLSFGCHGGAHDGTSLFETALAERLDHHNGEDGRSRLFVVLPAGNSQRQRGHVAARATEEPPSTERSLMRWAAWKVLPDDDGDNFVELWIPEGRQASVRLLGPDGAEAAAVTVGGGSRDQPAAPTIALVQPRGTGIPVGLVMAAERAPQSETQRMVLIALRSDRQPAGAPLESPMQTLVAAGGDGEGDEASSAAEPRSLQAWIDPLLARAVDAAPVVSPAPHGIWRIEVEPTDEGELEWHAWIQRGDIAPMRQRAAQGVAGRASRFLDGDPARGGLAPDPASTLNGIATFQHERLHVVGGMRASDHGLLEDGGAGPTLQASIPLAGPTDVVVSAESRLLPGLLLPGVLGGARQRVGGSSIAAAVYSGELARHLAAGCPPHSLSGSTRPNDRATRDVLWTAGAPHTADPGLRGEGARRVPKANGHLG